MKKHFTIPFATLMLFSAGAVHAQSTGKLLLEKGLKLSVENVVNTFSNMEMMGQQIEINGDVNMNYNMEVADKNPEGTTVKSTLTRMKLNTTAMGQSRSFDSEKPEDLEDEMGKVLKSEINQTTEVVLNESAAVVSIRRPNTENAGPSADAIKSMMNFGGEESGGAVLPFLIIPHGKKTGDSWQDSTVKEGNKVTTTYTLKQIDGTTATVSFAGLQSSSRKVEQMGTEVTVNMESKISGEAIVNTATGVIREKKTSMEGTGSTEIMGQSMPISNKVTITTTVK
jgi:hypothetical protein